MPYHKTKYRRFNGNGGEGGEEGKEKSYWYSWDKFFMWGCIVCTCLAAFVIIGLASFLVHRENNDDDDGAVKLPVEQSESDFLDQFLGNLQQTDDFIRCMSGCGAGPATPCNTTTDCIDPEVCFAICGKFNSQNPPARNCLPLECSGNQLCENICIRNVVIRVSCPIDCLCEKVDHPPGICGGLSTQTSGG